MNTTNKTNTKSQQMNLPENISYDIKNNNIPTIEQFNALTKMFNYFNKTLFDDSLPNCFLNLSRPRNNNIMGFFAPDRWKQSQDQSKLIHEISLSPKYLDTRQLVKICQTLVHEMVHLWQKEYGKPSRTSYHNKEWARKMMDVGLMPSDTGEPGGKTTGQKIADYVMTGGKFEKYSNEMPKEYLLPWTSNESRIRDPSLEDFTDDDDELLNDGDEDKKNKTKYSCPGCKINLWGKPGLNVLCGDCGLPLVSKNDEDEGEALSNEIAFELVKKIMSNVNTMKI